MNAQETERTRRVAARFAKAVVAGNRDALDRLLHEDAEWWVLGRGYLDRSAFLDVRAVDRPPPTSARRTLKGMTVDGDRAALEIEVEIYWPDGVYHNQCHHLIVVRDDRVTTFREYHDPHASRGFFQANLPAASRTDMPLT